MHTHSKVERKMKTKQLQEQEFTWSQLPKIQFMLKKSQTHSELLLIKEKGTAKSDERSVGLSDNGDN